ncbi:MAG: hypothetical protein ACE5OR_04325 [bacterium]
MRVTGRQVLDKIADLRDTLDEGDLKTDLARIHAILDSMGDSFTGMRGTLSGEKTCDPTGQPWTGQ